MRARLAALAALLPFAAPLAAQPAPPAPAPAMSARPAPKLLVVISVDQFSADLFAQYRQRFTGGLARLLGGAVFPSGYQSHAATETCPGHSTITTGMRPARTGIVANTWVDRTVGRPDKFVYCAEDERAPGSDHEKYVAADLHLRVPTLGDRLKAANAATQLVSVAGKDRAAIMMGGHRVDQLWFWDGKAFVSYAGRPVPATVTRANAAVAALIAKPQAPLPLPGWCAPMAVPIAAGKAVVGAGRFARAAGDVKAFRASPASDAAVLGIAFGLTQELKLGRGPATDMLTVGLSATDYVGHANGQQGAEMCIQMNELDLAVGAFLDALDGTGVDYEVALTADHGSHDLTERQRRRAMPMEEAISPALSVEAIGRQVGAKLGIAGDVLIAPDADVYVAPGVPPTRKAAVIAEAVRLYRAQPQVAAVLTAAEIEATPMPMSPPETWTLAERARASHDPERSGDFRVFLQPRITGIEQPGPGYVATHGSPWDYDRRVPILFWRRGMTGFEQPLSVETVDIAPTLAATVGLRVSGLDGRCLDLDAGPGDTCAAR